MTYELIVESCRIASATRDALTGCNSVPKHVFFLKAHSNSLFSFGVVVRPRTGRQLNSIDWCRSRELEFLHILFTRQFSSKPFLEQIQLCTSTPIIEFNYHPTLDPTTTPICAPSQSRSGTNNEGAANIILQLLAVFGPTSGQGNQNKQQSTTVHCGCIRLHVERWK